MKGLAHVNMPGSKPLRVAIHLGKIARLGEACGFQVGLGFASGVAR
jgi:hypothetical protein